MTKMKKHITDAESALIKKAKNGDSEAFSSIVETYSKRIYNIGLRMLGGAEDAADMTQEVLLKTYRYLGSFRGDSAFSTWIFRITVNSCKDALRVAYHKREKMFSDFANDEDMQEAFEVADISAIPEAVYEEEESEAYLLELINCLNPKYRIVIVLREISGLSYEEIAEAVNISMGTVKSRLSRARSALADKIIADTEQYPHLLGLINKASKKEVL